MSHEHPEGFSCGCAYAERLERERDSLREQLEAARAIRVENQQLQAEVAEMRAALERLESHCCCYTEEHKACVKKIAHDAPASTPKEPWALHKFDDLPSSIYPDTWSKGPAQ